MTAGTITALRVLLVEDDLADAALVERTLLRGGYKALVCRSAS